jgi:hypothetical protein
MLLVADLRLFLERADAYLLPLFFGSTGLLGGHLSISIWAAGPGKLFLVIQITRAYAHLLCTSGISTSIVLYKSLYRMGDHLTDVLKIRFLARLVKVNCNAKWVARAHGYITGYTHEIHYKLETRRDIRLRPHQNG